MFCIATKHTAKTVHIQGLAEKSTGSEFNYAKSACPSLSRTVFGQYHWSHDLAATIKKAESYARAYGKTVCKNCLKRAVELLAELAFEIEEAHTEALEAVAAAEASYQESAEALAVQAVEEAHTLAIQEDAHRVIAQAFPAEVAAAAETNPEYAPAQFLAEPVTETELAEYVEMWEAIPMAPGHEAPALFNDCRGDWTQRGCASGKPSVHRVTTHGATRDVCAYHSPFDVDDAHPVGWVQPEDYWTPGAGTTPATESVPAGGFPSPYAVAALVYLVQEFPRQAKLFVETPGVQELADRGFIRRYVPGLEVYVLADAGLKFAREHILGAPASS